MNKKTVIVFLIILAFIFLIFKSIYEKNNPVLLRGKSARLIAIASTGPDINSPVSYLFGRSPYFIVCDKLTGSYKSVANKFMDAPHAAGLRSAQMLVGLKVDAICGNNIGFEPSRVFKSANVEMYTNIKGTVWQTFQGFPEALVKVTDQTVPAHFGITQSKTPVPCNSFNAQANINDIVQGKFYMCYKCGYKISEIKTLGVIPVSCPVCGDAMHEVITVTAPMQTGKIKPKIRVF